jgi:hypothetical protein
LIIANSSPRSHLRSAFRHQIRRNLRMRHCSNLKTSNVKDLSLAAPEARINVVYRRKARLYRAPHPSYACASGDFAPPQKTWHSVGRVGSISLSIGG